jgi:hypothetical protein
MNQVRDKHLPLSIFVFKQVMGQDSEILTQSYGNMRIAIIPKDCK